MYLLNGLVPKPRSDMLLFSLTQQCPLLFGDKSKKKKANKQTNKHKQTHTNKLTN